MDPMNSAPAPRSDLVMVETKPRATPKPTRVAFGDVLAAGASGLAQGAQLAVSALPGSAVSATAVRGGGGTATAPIGTNISPSFVDASPEGAGGISGLGGASANGSASGSGLPVSLGSLGGSQTSTTDSSSSIQASLQQSAALNMYYLQLQEQVDAQNRTYTAQSNILKTEHDGAKNAIGNIHS